MYINLIYVFIISLEANKQQRDGLDGGSNPLAKLLAGANPQLLSTLSSLGGLGGSGNSNGGGGSSYRSRDHRYSSFSSGRDRDGGSYRSHRSEGRSKFNPY